MPIDNVLHIGNLTRYISVEYLGTTEVETATVALNVANPSTGNEGENGNCAYIYFCGIFLTVINMLSWTFRKSLCTVIYLCMFNIREYF